mgnify:CR=1 FL=1
MIRYLSSGGNSFGIINSDKKWDPHHWTNRFCLGLDHGRYFQSFEQYVWNREYWSLYYHFYNSHVLLMTPLQIKQQKFSKLSAVMQPEITKIQKKYQGKRDQISMQKMQEETSLVYQKYGVSPTGVVCS